VHYHPQISHPIVIHPAIPGLLHHVIAEETICESLSRHRNVVVTSSFQTDTADSLMVSNSSSRQE